ncbi:hypothetical protein [Paenibacillus naphthalenovorans]|uniref:hypothetical protein n=1 Tax=Paenibacillus naphthalenovorans TaxID=162209 RepID=UPI003D2D56FD
MKEFDWNFPALCPKTLSFQLVIHGLDSHLSCSERSAGKEALNIFRIVKVLHDDIATNSSQFSMNACDQTINAHASDKWTKYLSILSKKIFDNSKLNYL